MLWVAIAVNYEAELHGVTSVSGPRQGRQTKIIMTIVRATMLLSAYDLLALVETLHKE